MAAKMGCLLLVGLAIAFSAKDVYPQAAEFSQGSSAILITESGEGGGPGYSAYLRKTDGSPAVRLGEGSSQGFSPDGQWALAFRDLDAWLDLMRSSGAFQKDLKDKSPADIRAIAFDLSTLDEALRAKNRR